MKHFPPKKQRTKLIQSLAAVRRCRESKLRRLSTFDYSIQPSFQSRGSISINHLVRGRLFNGVWQVTPSVRRQEIKIKRGKRHTFAPPTCSPPANRRREDSSAHLTFRPMKRALPSLSCSLPASLSPLPLRPARRSPVARRPSGRRHLLGKRPVARALF